QIVLAVGSDKQFAHLCAAIGAPELANDPRFSTNPARVRERASLCAMLRKRILDWNQEELLQALHARAVPAGAVNNMKEVCEQPEVSSMLLDGTTSNGRRLQALRTVAFDVVGVGARAELSPPPHYGEHTHAILRDMLHYSDEAIQTLKERMCIYVPDEGTATGTG
ncbi:MAG TPA: CoA transferase, partial [Candidatus Acetothermia bacterium]|nr:CoA transferase [Candidatus Acetothermia bacterium]